MNIKYHVQQILKDYVSEDSSTKDVKISVTNNRTQPSSVLWLISVMGNIVGILSYLFIYLFRIGLLNENTHDSLQL